MPSAAVLGRGEYLKLNSESYCTSSSSGRVCSKSASVSPGKPTMMSVVSAMLRRAFLIHAMRSHILIARVEPLHGGEHPAGAGLHRQVDVIADHGIGVHGVHDGFDEIARVGRGEAHAANAGHLAATRQQRGEIPARGRRVAVAVDVLAEQAGFRV